jgi:hypothetical protein
VRGWLFDCLEQHIATHLVQAVGVFDDHHRPRATVGGKTRARDEASRLVDRDLKLLRIEPHHIGVSVVVHFSARSARIRTIGGAPARVTFEGSREQQGGRRTARAGRPRE